ncbi:MAG: hypothetical protein AAF497_19785, partial [Planctomycetota bacterium]
MSKRHHLRRLGFEALENRRQLAVLVVDSVADIDDGDFSAGNFTLREALGVANSTSDPDTVTFDESLSGATITLSGSVLPIKRFPVNLDASNLNSRLTIDANHQSSVIEVSALFDGEVTVRIAGLVITGGSGSG